MFTVPYDGVTYGAVRRLVCINNYQLKTPWDSIPRVLYLILIDWYILINPLKTPLPSIPHLLYNITRLVN